MAIEQQVGQPYAVPFLQDVRRRLFVEANQRVDAPQALGDVFSWLGKKYRQAGLLGTVEKIDQRALDGDTIRDVEVAAEVVGDVWEGATTVIRRERRGYRETGEMSDEMVEALRTRAQATLALVSLGKRVRVPKILR